MNTCSDLRESTLRARDNNALRIGITIGLRSESESLWTNGIKQNALYLAKTLMNSPRNHDVKLVNTTGIILTAALQWDLTSYATRTFDEIKDGLDVLIELGGQIDFEQTQYLRGRGTKIVSYCCGPEYVQNMEAIIFGRGDNHSLFINRQYDEVWIIPQIVETSFHFFKALRRKPVRKVPFVWDPMCLEQRAQDLPHAGEYRPRVGPRRLTVMEPNHDVVKFCLYPMLIADVAFQSLPEKIGWLHVTNAEHLAKHSALFTSIACSLDIVKQHKASFVGRFDTPEFLANYTDIVISHQSALPLNYFYFDVCWNGYALVHNAHLCRELGYFYAENDVDQGANKLISAIQSHDIDWEGYRKEQRKQIGKFLATSDSVILEYDALLDRLMANEPAD